MLKSRTTYPPDGWTFFQPQTGKSFGGLTFLQTVDAIVEHRRANPRFGLSVDPDVVARELDDYTCARINHNPHYCVSESAASFSFPPLPLRQSGGAVAAGVRAGNSFLKNASVGIKTYLDWFGNGTPETIPVAEARAEVCLKCEFNQKGGLVERFSQATANEIMAVMGVLKDLNLHTSRESELHVCSKCDCPLSAKVFAPIDIVRKHIRPETMASLPEWCWIKDKP